MDIGYFPWSSYPLGNVHITLDNHHAILFVVSTPLKKLVNWDAYYQYMAKNPNVPVTTNQLLMGRDC